MKRAVAYLRVSTDEQAQKNGLDEGYSIPAQRAACKRKAEQMEVALVDEYSDQGQSARSADRPALQTMLKRLGEQQDIDYVIVHKVDRLARNRLDDVTINMELQRAGAQLVSVSESIDATPSGQLLHAIMAANAEFFSKNLALETQKGLQQKFRDGGTIGLAPIGYMNTGHRVGGQEIRTIEVDPERAPLIAWAFEEYATGKWSLNQMRDALTERGLTTRATRKRPSKPLSTSSVGRILANRYYIGFTRYQGVEGLSSHPRLVSTELFERVQQVLNAKAGSGERSRKHQHYLRGSLYCGRCGSRLVMSRNKGNGGVYTYFFCVGRQRRNGCKQPHAQVPAIERQVEDYYRTVELTPARAEDVRKLLRQELKRRNLRLDEQAKQARRIVTRLDAERTKMLQAHLADAVPLDVLKREQERLTAELQGAQSMLAAAENRAQDEERIVDQAIDLAIDCQRAYKRATPTVRRLFNQAFFKQLLVVDDEISGAVLTEPYAELLANDLADRIAASNDDEVAESEPAPGPVPVGAGSNIDSKG